MEGKQQYFKMLLQFILFYFFGGETLRFSTEVIYTNEVHGRGKGWQLKMWLLGWAKRNISPVMRGESLRDSGLWEKALHDCCLWARDKRYMGGALRDLYAAWQPSPWLFVIA